MTLQTITLYGHKGGPNPWKVSMILFELGLPFVTKVLDPKDMKKEPYESINPNGRVPAIEDPNTGMTLWESGAIIEYLIHEYDKDHTISFTPNSKEDWEAKQWLYYQVSGQGPYFGQTVWFTVYHPEKVPSAVDRYINEIKRVSGVLDKFLSKKEYLVGNKYSYADFVFYPWYSIIGSIFADRVDFEKDYVNLHAWLERIKARPAIVKSIEDRDEILKNN